MDVTDERDDSGLRRAEIVVAGSHLRWRGVWQRPHHVLSRLSARVPVVVLEEPSSDGAPDDAVAEYGNVTVVTPRERATAGDGVDARSLDALRAIVGDRGPLVWLYTPMMRELAPAFPGAPVAFDKMDDLSAFRGADPRMLAAEAALVERADFTFAGGRSLYRGVRDRARASACYPSGVDAAHFAGSSARRPHPRLASFAGKAIYGYVGVIDERVDLELVARVADAYPEAIVAMVGPVTKIPPSALPRRPNVAYFGRAEYDELPAYLAGFDVGLMPFARNRHTASISPTKTLEYLAAGLPVVGTAIDDVVADFADVVRIARTREDFVRMVGAASAPDAERTLRAREKVDASSWDAIVAGMLADLATVGVAVGETRAHDGRGAAESQLTSIG